MLKNYVNPEEIKVLIEVHLYITQFELNKLGYKFKNRSKNVFINKHKQPNIMKDCANFFKVIKDLKPYIVKFKKNRTIKSKVYHDNYIIRSLY